jgi:ABC-type uncharacterized transport system substrate-binding protein
LAGPSAATCGSILRWAGANADDIRRHAAELAALAPDVILAHGASTVGPLLHATRTVPIVFPVVGDPVGAGFVDSLARPGGNATLRGSALRAKAEPVVPPLHVGYDCGAAQRSE